MFVVQLQVLMGYSSSLAGMVFVPMILFGIPLIAVMHEVAKRLDVRLLASLNAPGFAVTFYWIGLFDDPHSYDQIFWPMVSKVCSWDRFLPLLRCYAAWSLRRTDVARRRSGERVSDRRGSPGHHVASRRPFPPAALPSIAD